MLKYVAIFVLLVLSLVGTAQRVMDRAGKIRFYSEAPIENIEATNEKVMSIMDLTSGGVAVSIFIRDFRFEKPLMEEHFNENYLESSKYPKCTFSGTFQDFEGLGDGSFTLKAKGEITLHGVTQPLEADVEFEVDANEIKAKTTFFLKVADFDIEIPKVVFYNIAETIEVNASFRFDKDKME